MFAREGVRLLYQGKVCIPRSSVATIIELAHYSNIAGHCGFPKTCHDWTNIIGYIKGKYVKR